jgi:hypothetical protein
MKNHMVMTTRFYMMKNKKCSFFLIYAHMEGCTPFLFYQKMPTIKSKSFRQKNQYSSWATMFF